jgi:signal transduction histidine kinase
VGERAGLVAVVAVLPLAILCYPRDIPPLLRRTSLPLLVGFGTASLLWGATAALVQSGVLTAIVVVVFSMWWRYERGGVEHRNAILWVCLGLGVGILIAIPLAFADSGPVAVVAGLLGLLAVPGAVVLGMRPPEGVEIRALILRVAVYAAAMLLALAMFSGVVAALVWRSGTAPATGALGLIAVATAVAFHPVRRLLEAVIDRLLFGDRPTTARAAARFGNELSSSEDPATALRALREVLLLPYVCLEGDSGTVAVSGSWPAAGSYALPLRIGSTEVGRLVIGLRPAETGPAAKDRDVLSIVVPALAQVVHARALAAELKASRGRVVAAVENDRRRLRHELHDGVGPTLTGVAYAADAARNLVTTDPDEARLLLSSLRSDTKDAIAEIRRLVDGLRPPALDELGLIPALRQRCAHIYTAAGTRLDVQIRVVEGLPALSAAAEVAIYRIVMEALANVARHSGSRQAEVEITDADDAVTITISDHGGETSPWHPGVGLSSMRERAEQVGGTFAALPTDAGGRVKVRLPLPAVELPTGGEGAA